MKNLLALLALAAILVNTGCSTNRHLLEPGVDKYKGINRDVDVRAGCCSNRECACGQDHMDQPCSPCQRVQP
jgi:hypothetical protein